MATYEDISQVNVTDNKRYKIIIICLCASLIIAISVLIALIASRGYVPKSKKDHLNCPYKPSTDIQSKVDHILISDDHKRYIFSGYIEFDTSAPPRKQLLELIPKSLSQSEDEDEAQGYRRYMRLEFECVTLDIIIYDNSKEFNFKLSYIHPFHENVTCWTDKIYLDRDNFVPSNNYSCNETKGSSSIETFIIIKQFKLYSKD